MFKRIDNFLVAVACSLAVLGTVFFLSQPAGAQESTPQAPEERPPLSAAELEELVGPIALYPDDLVSIVLPASTYPLQIVQAARYLEAHESDNDLEPNESWDDSVVALLNYPEVIELMNEDLDWTWELGEAALYQQTELLDAIQDFRDRAYAAGNLQTDERQVVTKDAETIVIVPAEPEVIYVPYYDPRYVVVHQPHSVYHYYPHPYPSYYYPYSYGHSFGSGFFWGVTTAFSIGWHSHYLQAHHYSHYSHPYYGHYYHYPWYRQHSVSVSYGESRWRPSYYTGARPQDTATVVRTNRNLGATSASRGRFRTVDDDSPVRPSTRNTGSRVVTGSSSGTTVRTQPSATTRQGTTRTLGTVSRSRDVNGRTAEAAERARAASPSTRTTARTQQRTTTPRSSTTTSRNADSTYQTRWGSLSRQRTQPTTRQSPTQPSTTQRGTTRYGTSPYSGSRQTTTRTPSYGGRSYGGNSSFGGAAGGSTRSTQPSYGGNSRAGSTRSSASAPARTRSGGGSGRTQR